YESISEKYINIHSTYAKSRATPKFFALKLRKTERQQFFSPQTSTNPPHNNIFRPKPQQIRPTAKILTPTPSKSAPLQNYSRQTPSMPHHNKNFLTNTRTILVTLNISTLTLI